jgi:hypothetical protein
MYCERFALLRFSTATGYPARRGQKAAILHGILRRPVIRELYFLANDNLQSETLSFAEAFFEILLRPETEPLPPARQHQRHFVAAVHRLRVEKRG